MNKKIKEEDVIIKRNLEDEFKVHILNKQGIEKAKKIQNLFADLAFELMNLTNEKGITLEWERAVEHLQIACFLVKRDMACSKINQKVE